MSFAERKLAFPQKKSANPQKQKASTFPNLDTYITTLIFIKIEYHNRQKLTLGLLGKMLY